MSGELNFTNEGSQRLALEQGARFFHELVLKDKEGTVKDLTGFAARMQARNCVEDTDTILDMNASNGQAVVTGGANSKVTLDIGADITKDLVPGSYVYDLEIFETAAPTNVTRVVEGKLDITAEVTR